MGISIEHSTERCRKTGTSRKRTRLLLVAGQRWPGQGFRDFSWSLLSLIDFELWDRRRLREADRVGYGVVWAAIARSTSCISKTSMFSGYLFIRYARGPRVCVVCDGRNTTAQVSLEDKKKSRQNGFSKLESERKAVQPERDSRSHTNFKIKNRKNGFSKLESKSRTSQN